MLGNSAQAATTKILLSPADAADTAGATSDWVACADAEGAIMVVVQTGVITGGGIVYTIETASDDQGTGSGAITPTEGAFAAVTAGQIQKRTVDASAVKGYLRIKGTVTTGPVQCSASLVYRPKYV